MPRELAASPRRYHFRAMGSNVIYIIATTATPARLVSPPLWKAATITSQRYVKSLYDEGFIVLLECFLDARYLEVYVRRI